MQNTINNAILKYGAKAVYAAANDAFFGKKSVLESMIGACPNLGIVHAAHTAAQTGLSSTEKKTDYKSAAAALGSIKTAKKATASRANGAKGGRPRKDAPRA